MTDHSPKSSPTRYQPGVTATTMTDKPNQSMQSNGSGGAGINQAVYMRFDERKWATTLVKVFKHMKLMEKQKYLEPLFSSMINPIV
jgi:hypothetical protein